MVDRVLLGTLPRPVYLAVGCSQYEVWYGFATNGPLSKTKATLTMSLV